MSTIENQRLTIDQVKRGETIRPSSVPDPLEGVIPGENRHERYKNFMIDVLGKIWPRNPESGEYGDDFWRATRFEEGSMADYTHFAPLAKDPIALTPVEFETMVENLGTADYVRVRMVSPQVIQLNTSIILTGGSCAIETHGMRNIADINAGIEKGKIEPSVLPEVARRILDFSPTITHVSGAMIPGKDGIHYVEDDMWAERIESYGLSKTEAQKRTTEAYERINDAVSRRARLIDPTAKLIIVNFNELHLQTALKSWFEEIGMQYDPSVRVAEVIHTYVGRKQKTLLQQALENRVETDHLSDEEKEIATSMLQRNLHIRGKQIDHGRWGSMNLPKEVIMGKRQLTPEEKAKYDTDYAYRMGIDIMTAVRKAQEQNSATSIYVGFADLPGPKNMVQHESRDVGLDFKGTPGSEEFNVSLQTYLETPARLHRGNVSEHLSLLRSYIRPDAQQHKAQLVTLKRELSLQKNPITKRGGELANEVKKYSDRQAIKEARQKEDQETIELVRFLQFGSLETPITEKQKRKAKILKQGMKKTLEPLSRKSPKEQSEQDQQDVRDFSRLANIFDDVEQGQKPILSPEDNELLNKKVIRDVEIILTQTAKDLQETKAKRSSAENELRAFEEENGSTLSKIQTRIDAIDTEMKTFGGNLFPLSENVFIHHSMQFLWDPDFPAFLKHAVTLQDNLTAVRIEKATIQARLDQIRTEEETKKRKGESMNKGRIKQAEEESRPHLDAIKIRENDARTTANDQMRGLMRQIYPKLETYIRYLYGEIDYPMEIRNTRFFSI